MEIGYEEKYDILGIIINNKYEYSHTVEVKPLFVIDIDKNKNIAAMEFVDISKQLKTTPQHIKTAKIKPFIECYEYSCKVGINIELKNGKKEEIWGQVYL